MSSSSPLSRPNVAQFLKLTYSNYLTWLRQIKPFIIGHDLWKICWWLKPTLGGTFTVIATPFPTTTNSDNTSIITTAIITSSTIPNPDFIKWYQQDQLVVSYITSTIDGVCSRSHCWPWLCLSHIGLPPMSLCLLFCNKLCHSAVSATRFVQWFSLWC